MAFVALAFGVATSESVNASLNYSESYNYYTGRNADTIGVGDSVFIYKVRKKSLKKLVPYMYVALDSTGGTSNIVTVTLESKVFPDEDYKIRETVDWHDGSDTTVVLVSDTAHISEYWQIKLSGADDTFKAKVTQLNFKFIEE